MAKQKKVFAQEQLADALFPLESQAEFEEAILSIPPEKRVLRTEQYDFSVSSIVAMMEKDEVSIPEYQRRYVWSDRQASRLIESLIIQCPIPVIYLNQERDETLAVIDGNQRLNSIRNFVENKFALTGLTSYPELTGLRFYDLDKRFQRHINNRVLRFTVILKETHPQVKFDVFERLNSGAVALTRQELRHGLYYGELLKMANKVARNAGIEKHLGGRNDKRMKAEELVLRFLALHENLTHYEKPLATFISAFADENRNPSKDKLEKMQDAVLQAFERTHTLFGDQAFKYSKAESDGKFNAAVFDAQLLAVSKLTKERFNELSSQETKIQKQFKSLMQQDESFIKWVSLATSDKTSIQGRVAKVSALLKGI